jgi:hypothetical protein
MSKTQIGNELIRGTVHPAALDHTIPHRHGYGEQDAEYGDGRENLGQGKTALIAQSSGALFEP